MLLGTFDNSLIGRLVVSLKKQPYREQTMSGLTLQQEIRIIAKLVVLWILLLVLPFAERILLGAKTYYFLYIGLGLVFVLYGLTVLSLSCSTQDESRFGFGFGLGIWRGPFLFAVFCQSSLSNTIFFPRRQSHQLRMADL